MWLADLIKDVQLFLDPQGHVCDTDSTLGDGPLPEAHISQHDHCPQGNMRSITGPFGYHVPSLSWPQQVMNEGIFTPAALNNCPHCASGIYDALGEVTQVTNNQL